MMVPGTPRGGALYFQGVPVFSMKEELKEEMLKKAVDGKLPCAAAMKIAESLGLQFREVGEAANELGIKIKNCQLGCF
jgi:hypothetical protein